LIFSLSFSLSNCDCKDNILLPMFIDIASRL
jgi:hypothetical protein